MNPSEAKKPIHIGLLFYPHLEPGATSSSMIEDSLHHARLAEDLGFDSLWTGHHYLTDDQTLQPIPLLARISGEATKIRLGAWFLLSLGNPVDLAEQLASLDVITNGRLICGAVMGYRDVEFQALGVSKADRVARFVEAIEVMNLLWTRDRVSYESDRVTLQGVSLHTKPAQSPRPPIWVGANSVQAVRRAARIGDAWAMSPYATLSTLKDHSRIYDKALGDVGREPRSVGRPLLRDVYIASDGKRAWDRAERFLAPFYRKYIMWGKEEAMGHSGELSLPFSQLAEDRFIIGEPSQFVEQIHRYREVLRADTFILQINRPGMMIGEILEGVRLLGEKVLPHFK